jgi:hypothetical protein
VILYHLFEKRFITYPSENNFPWIISFLLRGRSRQWKRIVYYKLGGTKIEKNVSFGHQAFPEEFHPELIIIKEHIDLDPRIIVLTHETVLFFWIR